MGISYRESCSQPAPLRAADGQTSAGIIVNLWNRRAVHTRLDAWTAAVCGPNNRQAEVAASVTAKHKGSHPHPDIICRLHETPLTGGTRLGPHQIECSLRAGGMGEVYKARDGRLNRWVAIEVLPADGTGARRRPGPPGYRWTAASRTGRPGGHRTLRPSRCRQL